MLESYKSNVSYEDLKTKYAESERTELIPGVLMKVKKTIPSGEPMPVGGDDNGNGGLTQEFTVLKLAIPIGDTKSIVFTDPESTDIQNLSYATGSLDKVFDLSGFDFDMSSLGIDKLSTDIHNFTQDLKTKIENFGK